MKLPELLVILKGVLEHVDPSACEVCLPDGELLREVLVSGDGKRLILTDETWEEM